MFKLPFYTFKSYPEIMWKPYSGDSWWIDVEDFLSILTPDFVAKYCDVNSTRLWDYLVSNSTTLKASKITIWGKIYTTYDVLTAVKLLFPTLWTCNYFIWNEWKWTHHWIDILIPRWTPLPAFGSGKIVRIKTWDWKTKNEWNCVVLETIVDNEKVYIWYEHMDNINVTLNQIVKQWDVIWFCGTTWNSTQYHLHLQTDKSIASTHPYYNAAKNPIEIQKFTHNPIEILRKILVWSKSTVDVKPIVETPKTESKPVNNIPTPELLPSKTVDIFKDMPADINYKDAITKLYNAWLVKGSNGLVNPDNYIKRSEFILLLYRVSKKFDLLSSKSLLDISKKFPDVDYNDKELWESIDYLLQYCVINSKSEKFNPWNNVTWEESLAFLGRIFFDLIDSSSWYWYQTYLDRFISEEIITEKWLFIGKNISRKDFFKLLSDCLSKKWLI